MCVYQTANQVIASDFNCRYCSETFSHDLPICENCSDWELLCNLAEDRDNGHIFKWRVAEIANEIFGLERANALLDHHERKHR